MVRHGGRLFSYIMGFLVLFVFVVTGCSDNDNDRGVINQPSENSPPVIKLNGKNFTVLKGEIVTLSAEGSYDPDGDKIYFQWTDLDGLFEGQQINYSASTITGVADKLGSFRFLVKVFDLYGGEASGEVVVDVGRTYTSARISVSLLSTTGGSLPEIVAPHTPVTLKIFVDDPDMETYGDTITCSYGFYMSGVTTEYTGYVNFSSGITERTLPDLNLPFDGEGKVELKLVCYEPDEGGQIAVHDVEKSFLQFYLLPNGEPEAIFVSSGRDKPYGSINSCYDQSVTDGAKWGTPLYPYRCITSAVERMKNESDRKKIYIAEGFYNEQVKIDTPFEMITGGWTTDWKRKEDAEPVIYYDPGEAPVSNDYDTPSFSTYTMAFLYDGSIGIGGMARVEDLVVLPSRSDQNGVSVSILVDSGTQYDDSTQTATHYLQGLLLERCTFPMGVTDGATYFPDEVNVVVGLQAEDVWFDRIFVSDYLYPDYVTGRLDPESDQFYFHVFNLNPTESRTMLRFSNFGLSNSIMDIAYSNGEIFKTRKSDGSYTYIDQYAWILNNTILLRRSGNIVMELPLWRYNSDGYGQWLTFIGNLVKPGPSSYLFWYCYLLDNWVDNYLFIPGSSADDGAGSFMFNLFVMENDTVYFTDYNFNTKVTTLKAVDELINNGSGAKAESRYNSAIGVDELNLDGGYSYSTTSSIGVDGGYLPTRAFMGLDDSSWDFLDGLLGRDFYGNPRGIDVVGFHTCNADYLNYADYRAAVDCFYNGSYREIYWVSGGSYPTSWSFTDDTLIPTDIGAVELQSR